MPKTVTAKLEIPEHAGVKHIHGGVGDSGNGGAGIRTSSHLPLFLSVLQKSKTISTRNKKHSLCDQMELNKSNDIKELIK